MRPTLRYDPKRVFVVHGHDDIARLTLTRFLESLGLKPIVLQEKENEGQTIIEKIEKQSNRVGYAFVILTPDDLGGKSRRELKHRARQNVILELGYFMGKIGRKRTCCITKKTVEFPSDMHGVVYVPFDKTIEECFHNIERELRKAGYELNPKT
jgi:predicted nucleotide-binding protein